MSFEIGIPTLNRADLLMPQLLLYKKDFPDVNITVVDNGRQCLKSNLHSWNVIENDTNIGVAASWNMLCDKIFETASHALILNDDIYLRKNRQDIEELLNKKQYKGAFIRATPDWCAFIISKKIWETVGRFDELFFPAYYEDKSYEYRMKLKMIPVIKTPILNPFIYRNSKTLDKYPQLIEFSKKNKQLYIEMWGGEPGEEKFKAPFNKK